MGSILDSPVLIFILLAGTSGEIGSVDLFPVRVSLTRAHQALDDPRCL